MECMSYIEKYGLYGVLFKESGSSSVVVQFLRVVYVCLLGFYHNVRWSFC